MAWSRNAKTSKYLYKFTNNLKQVWNHERISIFTFELSIIDAHIEDCVVCCDNSVFSKCFSNIFPRL